MVHFRRMSSSTAAAALVANTALLLLLLSAAATAARSSSRSPLQAPRSYFYHGGTNNNDDSPAIIFGSNDYSASLINQLRGGGPKFWSKKKGNGDGDEEEEEYEYYEEYYDEDDNYYNDNSAVPSSEYEYYEEEDNDAAAVEGLDDYDDYDEQYVLSAPLANNKPKQQQKGGNKNRLFRFGAPAKQQQQQVVSSSSGGGDEDNSTTKKEERKQKSSSNNNNKGGRFTSAVSASSRASFVPSLRKSSSFARGGSLDGTATAITTLLSGATSIVSKYISTISQFIMLNILQPLCSTLNTVTWYMYSTLSHYIMTGLHLLRDLIDVIWYGPGIDGITTTGVIASRYGGLQGIMFGSTTSMMITAVVGVGLISWMVVGSATSLKSFSNSDVGSRSSKRRRIFLPMTWWKKGRVISNSEDQEEDDDDELDANPHFSLEPPTMDEELQFISRTFKSTNPSSKQRISESITTNYHRGGLFRRFRQQRSSRKGSSTSPRRQRKLTVKSIQNWWKRDPNSVNGGKPVNIVKRDNYNNNSRSSSSINKNPSISQLQNQLSKAEQERYLLQNDIQKLQLRLQKAQSDARNIASQNKWLEKQTSRADQILSRAVEVERKKANEEVERVRGEMRGVLERERLMMRGNIGGSGNVNGSVGGVVGSSRRMIGGGNDIDLNRGPTKRVMDGVKIVRDFDDYDDEDSMYDEHGRPPWKAM